jgi:hypothetical protein
MSINIAPQATEFEMVQPGPIPEQEPAASRWRNATIKTAKILIGATFPLALSATAIEHGSPEHIEIAGQDVAVKPVIGKNTTDFEGAVIRPEHKRLFGMDIGVNIQTDLNNLLPQDKQERGYLAQLWQNPEPEKERIQEAAKDYMLKWGLGGLAVGLLMEGGAYGMVRLQRRRLSAEPEIRQKLITRHNAPRNWLEAGLAATAVTGIYATGVHALAHEDHHVVQAQPALNGTPLEGTEVNGLAGRLVPLAVALFSPQQEHFYEKATANLQEAIDKVPSLLTRQDGEVLYLSADDIEGVGGMAQLYGTAAKTMDADRLLYTGDWTFGGSSLESYILDYPGYYSEHLPILSAAGLHDTDTILQAEASRDDITLADNQTHTYEDLKLLMLNDPRVSTIGRFGTADLLRDPNVDVNTFVANAVQDVCNTHPDLVALHDHKLADLIIQAAHQQGCELPLVIDGRSYTTLGVQQHDADNSLRTVEYTNGSAGAHTNTNPNPGIIESDASMTPFIINKETGTVTFFPITVHPDASVTIDRLTTNLTAPEAATGRGHTDHVTTAHQAN